MKIKPKIGQIILGNIPLNHDEKIHKIIRVILGIKNARIKSSITIFTPELIKILI
jgi:hypothetical protein